MNTSQHILINNETNITNEIIETYEYLINANYSQSEIQIYCLIKYNINIEEPTIAVILTKNKKRIGQHEFKTNLINLYGNYCMLTKSNAFDACHIIPFADSHNMSVHNGLLLNQTHHKMFDQYKWSINPKTLEITTINSNDPFILMLKNLNNSKTNCHWNKIKHILSPKTIQYIKKHYKHFLKINVI
jgi:hypothetical protein